MKISIFAKNSPGIYSGGRYHSWIIAESLASAGNQVTYITNNIPAFIGDFTDCPAHDKIKFILTDDFRTSLPSERQDIAAVVPQLTYLDTFFSDVSNFAKTRCARLVLWNFESPNWFNEFSPTKRDPALWEGMINLCHQKCLVISTAKIGMDYAKKFFTRFPETTEFDYCYPAINSIKADQVERSKKTKRIILLTRFSDDHKGGKEIQKLLIPEMKGYTLVIIVGNCRLGYQERISLLRKASGYGVKIEFKFAISDAEKFKEIKQSSLLLFPSLFEGYGYPPIEAGYCGVPCVCFDLDVLKEVNHDQVVYVPYKNYKKYNETTAELIKGTKTFDPDPEYYTFATITAYGRKLHDIFERFLSESSTSTSSVSPRINSFVNDFDSVLSELCNVLSEWNTNEVSIYGAGKNGHALYGLLTTLGVKISYIFNDGSPVQVGSHTTVPFDDELCRTPVFIALSKENPSIAKLSNKVKAAKQQVHIFG